MYRFEIYCDQEVEGPPVKIFEEPSVEVAFEAAQRWIHKQYAREDNVPDFKIVSKFGVLHV